MLDSRWPEPYIGLPYKRFGRTREGIDCWGLPRLVILELFGFELPSYGTIDPDDIESATHVIATEKLTSWKEVYVEGCREFDFVLMRSVVELHGRQVSRNIHIGLIAPRNHILHVQEDADSVCVPYSKLSHRVVQILRHKELTNGRIQ